MGTPFRCCLTMRRTSLKKYMISYLPTNFIINRRGEISAVHIGLMEYEGMEDYIEAAFRE